MGPYAIIHARAAGLFHPNQPLHTLLLFRAAALLIAHAVHTLDRPVTKSRRSPREQLPEGRIPASPTAAASSVCRAPSHHKVSAIRENPHASMLGLRMCCAYLYLQQSARHRILKCCRTTGGLMMTPPTPPKPAGGTICYVDSVPCTEYTTPFRVSTRREKKSRKDENGRGRGCGLLEGPRAADLPSSSLKPGGGARTNKLGRRFALPLFPICHRTQSRTAYRLYPPRHTHPPPPRRTPLFFFICPALSAGMEPPPERAFPDPANVHCSPCERVRACPHPGQNVS